MKSAEVSLVTDAEWEVMRIVWAHGEVTSREVTQFLNENKEWKNTTVKTLLSRLVSKGMLATESIGNKFVYHALVEERKSIQGVSKELLGKVCSKKVGAVIEEMILESLLSFSDIDQLEVALKEKRKEAVEIVPCNCVVGQCQCHLHK